jgi:SAM-dependent methyltransferase
MTDHSHNGPLLEALRRTVDLMRPEHRTGFQDGAGYIDLLGEEDRLGPHAGQQLYRLKTLPLLYERFTRPLVGRFFFGGKMDETEERRVALEMLNLSAGGRALDVGCGPGNYTRSLAEIAQNGLVIGIDASEPMIASAAKRGGGSNLVYVRGDGSVLPFLDGVFDAISCIGAIHMMEEPMLALDEMVRVLVPGGRLVIVATCSAKEPPPSPRGGMTIFGRDELTSAMAERGLTDIEQTVKWRGQFVAASKATTPSLDSDTTAGLRKPQSAPKS